MAESSARSVIRPHGEEARACRGGFETRPYKKARAVSNDEGELLHAEIAAKRCGIADGFRGAAFLNNFSGFQYIEPIGDR